MRHFIQSSDHRFYIISIDAAAKPKKIEKQQFVVFHWSLTLQNTLWNNMFNKIFERNTLSFATTSDPDVKSTFDKLSPTPAQEHSQKNIPNNKEIRERL
jgi:hypothetical protein